MIATENLIKTLTELTDDKKLIGRKCKIKPEVMENYRKNGCDLHADLCEGVLTIIETQKGWGGQFIVRVQNEKIKNIHPDCGDLLNSFPKSLDEIELL